MRDLFLNENGDIEMDGQDIAQIEDDEELAQAVTNILSIQKGEFQPETELGTDYVGAVISGRPEEIQDVEDAIDEALEQEPRISGITDISSELDEESRELDVTLSLSKASDDEENIEVGVSLNAG